MKQVNFKRLGILAAVLALSVCLVIPGGASAKEKQENVGASSVVVTRTADVVFIIDTTGSMSDAIDNVKRNLNNFLDKMDKEGVDVRVRFVSFRDGGCDYISQCAESKRNNISYNSWVLQYQSPTTYPQGTGNALKPGENDWYTKATVEDAKKALESGPFKTLGGGWSEAPMVPMAELTTSGYFDRPVGSPQTLAKFCILITDEPYDKSTYYLDENSNSFGDSSLDEASLIKKMQEEGIHTSVITEDTLFTTFGKFKTPDSNLTANDGGMLTNIHGDYDIIFEKLAEKIADITIQKEKEIIIQSKKNITVSPIKIRANMIVLGKQKVESQYMCIEGKVDEYVPASWAAATVQTSPVFKGLKADTEYSFYVENASGAGIVTQKTETETGARFGQIPAVVYEGEIFNIKPSETIRQMLVTSGGSVNWSCDSDCVTISNDDAGHGCKMQIVDCEYNNNKLLELTLKADVTYSVKGNKGTIKTKTRTFKEKFKIENEVDAMDIGEFLGTSENIYQDGIIQLRTLDGVSMNMIINQGEATDTASRQRLSYYISDEYGVKNPNGKKIATVTAGGKIKGVRAGVTYLTIAPRHCYNKYGKTYDFIATIPIVCQDVSETYFDKTELENEDDNILRFEKDESKDDIVTSAAFGIANENSTEGYIIKANAKDKINLRPYLKFNPAPVFNVEQMKQRWISSDTEVVTVNSKGQIKCKNPGYATITVTPVGGIKISAATGKRDVNAKECSATIKIRVVDGTEEQGTQ